MRIEAASGVPRTQRSAISAFTRVFDALWHLRSGALQSRVVTERGVWYGPGSAKQREERCIAPGTRSSLGASAIKMTSTFPFRTHISAFSEFRFSVGQELFCINESLTLDSAKKTDSNRRDSEADGVLPQRV
jgi:hypothetical protein